MPVGGVRVAFVPAGDCDLEALQNFDPTQAGGPRRGGPGGGARAGPHGGEVRHGAPGTTRQNQGAIAGFVAARGPGLHHGAVKTADIGAALAALERVRVRLIERVGRPGSRRAGC